MSNIKVSALTPSDEPAWQAYVNAHPDATIYHTLEWRDILYNEYRFKPMYLMAKEDGKVVGVFPILLLKNLRGRRLVSLPFSIYGGPLADGAEITSALIWKCMEMVKEGKASSVEIKPHTHIGDNVAELEAVECGIGTTIDLAAGIDILWKRLTDRNDVNRAVREGLSFSISDGDTLDRFYRLQLMTRKRLGLPIPSIRYYRSFFDKMSGRVKLGLVEKEGIPAAGGLFFVHKSTILYALGASDQKYLHVRPNDLLIWEMMKWGCEKGFKVFDLGTTQMNDRGLMHFKEKWGGKEALVKRYFYPAVQKLSNREGSVLLKMLPLPVSKVMGPNVIRYLG